VEEAIGRGAILGRSADRVRRFPSGTWPAALLPFGLAALLLLEIGIVRERFHTDRFLGDGRPWARLLLEMRYAAPVGIATLAAWALIAWRSLAREYAGLARTAPSPARSVAWFGLHLLVFAGFFAWTGWTFMTFEPSGPLPALGVTVLWMLGAIAVPASAAAVAFEPRALCASASRLLPSFFLAFGIGLTAFALNRVVLALGLWQPLLAATARLAAALLALLPGTRVQVELVAGHGYSITAGEFWVVVARQCSGVEGVALIWTFLVAYGLAFRRSLRFPQTLVLLPVATLLVWVLNAVRLAALVWIGEHVSAEVALQGFHSYAGWIVFCGLALGVVYVGQSLPWLARRPRAAVAPEGGSVNPAALYLGPFLAVLATSFATGAVSGGFDALYPLRVLAGAAVLCWARAELPRVRREAHGTGILFGCAAFALWLGLERLGVQPREARAAQALAELAPVAAAAWIAFRALGFVVVAPLVEELAFRGFLARRLVARDFEGVGYRAITPFAWALSSLAFGLLHGQWIAGTLAGALFGLAALRRGRLGDAIVAHATTNILLVVYWGTVGPWHGWL